MLGPSWNLDMVFTECERLPELPDMRCAPAEVCKYCVGLAGVCTVWGFHEHQQLLLSCYHLQPGGGYSAAAQLSAPAPEHCDLFTTRLFSLTPLNI